LKFKKILRAASMVGQAREAFTAVRFVSPAKDWIARLIAEDAETGNVLRAS
jgi:hypothetical protein